MATSPTSKYFVTSSQGGSQDFLDFGLSYGAATISTAGEYIRYIGSGLVDEVVVGPAMTVDLTASASGIDRFYLAGSLADYSLSVDATVRTLTLSRIVAGQTETAIVTGGSASNYDLLVFADGAVNSNSLYNAVVASTALPLPNASDNSLHLPALPVQNAIVKAYALNQSGETFASVKPGVNLVIHGGGGVDKVYVPMAPKWMPPTLEPDTDLI